jgi:CubicO group peptidase (beta-lactamase class C family)
MRQIEDHLVLLENDRNLLPLDRLDTLKVAAISIGNSDPTVFQQTLADYMQVDFFNLPGNFSEHNWFELTQQLKSYNLLLIGFHSIEDAIISKRVFEAFTSSVSSVFVCFDQLAMAQSLNNQSKPSALIIADGNDSLTQSLTAQMIFGGIGSKGKLSRNIGLAFSAGQGIIIPEPVRLKYTIPEELNINSDKLSFTIDSIVNDGLAHKAFPGCNVLVAVEGKIIFRKAYGYHTYDLTEPSAFNDIYDLASVTKIGGGLPGILKLYDEGKIELDRPVSDYYHDWKNQLFHRSDKSDVTIRELYAHQSGLIPFLPFYKRTIEAGKLSPKWFAEKPDSRHPLCVAPGMYLDKKFLQYVYSEIRKTPLQNRGKYVYSDLPLVITPQIITNLTECDFSNYLQANFYRPLGAPTLGYLPLERFPVSQIVPTENDRYFRFQQLKGTVHDESAAVLGGISGNAGLFASANDLAKLMQMYLQMGTYGGKRYVGEISMKEFSRVQFPANNNRRGLIFDKPTINRDSIESVDIFPCAEVSPESFGHSGYTGTFVWMDPKTQLLYIFLSNRVYPTRNNNLIGDMNIRTKILSEICRQIERD